MKKIWMVFWLIGLVACQTSRPVQDNTYRDAIEQARTLSFLIIYPEEEIVVVTLVNLSRARLNDLAFRIANQFLSIRN